MPVDPMIARPYVAQFGDTLREAMRTKVADDYRNALMQQRNNELAFEREQAAATAAQEDEEERLWDEAYARKDWGALARIDPQTTRVLMEHEKAQQAQTAEAEKQQAIAVYHAAKAGNPMARNFALKKLSETTPGIFQGMDADTAWSQIEPIMRQTLGIEAEQEQGIKIGQYNPGDYTPQTWARFLQSKDPSVLARQYAPPSPPSQTVIQLPEGQAAFNPRTGQTTLLSSREEQREAEAADAAATTAAQEGAKADADKGVKRGPQASMDYIINQRFRPLLVNGYRTYSGMREFSNLRQQLSTELRTIFRIPGEGTLSDREQAQYGLQLPSILNPDSLNGQILTDIQNRIGLRLGDQQAAPAGTEGGLTPEEKAELEALRKRFRGQ